MKKGSKDRYAVEREIEKLSVVMPIYNEARTCEIALRKLNRFLSMQEFKSEIVVVESNSQDGTKEILRNLNKEIPFKLIEEEKPEGKGSAVRNGMHFCTGEVVLIYDADLEYEPEDITQLVMVIESGQSSFALGSRHGKLMNIREMPGAKTISLIMNCGHILFCWMLNSTLGTSLKDPFTMYKVFRREIFENVELQSKRFDLDWELVILAVRLGSIPVEISVTYKSRSFEEGKKIRFVSDPISWFIALVKFRFLPVKRK